MVILTALFVIAKDPRTSPAKTRLAASIGRVAARRVAEAMLADTIEAVMRTPVDRRVLVLAGEPGPWIPPEIEVIAQRGHGLDERLAAAFEDLGAGFIIGSDTPQVTPSLLTVAAAKVSTDTVPIGPAADGGYWGIGADAHSRHLFAGVPMSTPFTFDATIARIAESGRRAHVLPTLRDVDNAGDLVAVAAACTTTSRTARVVAELMESLPSLDDPQSPGRLPTRAHPRRVPET